MEQFKLKVGRCFALISNHLGGFDLFVTGRRHFLLSERSLSFNNVMITLTSARPSARTVELASVFRTYTWMSYAQNFKSILSRIRNEHQFTPILPTIYGYNSC